MSVLVTFNGDHPLTVAGNELSGYHRPLGGESANLAVTVEHDALFAGWLACPPLGVGCEVSYGAESIMLGYLYGVRATTKVVELRIEG